MAIIFPTLSLVFFQVYDLLFGSNLHLIDNFQRQTMVIGHRGGNFAPENSLLNFKRAIDNNIDGIEFDVWLSKDQVPMVLHGGANGQLHKYGLPDEYVYNWTKDDLKSKIDIGEGQKMPTLEEVLQLCQESPKMLLNIEMKMPFKETQQAQYDHVLAVKKVLPLVEKYNAGRKVIIASFHEEILDAVLFEQPSPDQHGFKLLKILNHKGEEDPSDGEISDGVDGTVIRKEFLTEELVLNALSEKHLLGVYHDMHHQLEDEEMYRSVFTVAGTGVKLFYSDEPVVAMRARDRIIKLGGRHVGL